MKAEFYPPCPPNTNLYLHVPVYNLEPTPGLRGKLGFIAVNAPVTVDLDLPNTSPPYTSSPGLDQHPSDDRRLLGSRSTLWGNPSDHAHDSLRGNCIGDRSPELYLPQSDHRRQLPGRTSPRRPS